MTATVDRAAGADLSALYVFGGAGACALVIVGMVWGARPASAVPSFARQTGQPCATCHNGAFPQLTPYGRQFKLNGYTAGGTRCWDRPEMAAAGGPTEVQIPISGLVLSSFTHIQKDLASAPGPGLGVNNDAMIQDVSVFVAGQIYCNLGAFAQWTYDRAGDVVSSDNWDVRYANKTKFGGVDLVYGLDYNNNPTVEDPWNTTPAWRVPGGGSWSSSIAVGGAPVSPQIENFGQIVAGLGAYTWVNNEFYAFISAYKPLDKGALQFTGQDPNSAVNFDGVAPYWRLAVEKTWDVYSLMLGTYGMKVDIIPDTTQPTQTDKFTDVGFDTQFQYISDRDFVTLRASYTYEWQKLDASFGAATPAVSNLKNYLSELVLSATYAYDAKYAVTASYFDTQGGPDATFYSNSPTSKPNTSGEIIDFSYYPWSRGGPSIWPWLNTRLGVSFTHFDKINGTANNTDTTLAPIVRNARDDNTTYLYSLTAF